MSDFYDNIAYVLGHTLYLNITNRCPCACDFCIRTHSKSVGTGDNLWLEREPTQTEIMAALAQHDLSQYRELVFAATANRPAASTTFFGFAIKSAASGTSPSG